MSRLAGKIAIITGATSGIGERSVEIFVEEGAQVVFCGRREELGEALAERIGPKAEFIRADVAVEDDVANLIDITVERHGRLDVLFNNAGGPALTGSIAEVDTEFYERALAEGCTVGQESDSPRGRFVYFLDEGHPGSVIEMADLTEARRRIFDGVREAARDWDGSDPIRQDWPR
ncbi:MAG TPA: SDR family NAD(P)-dependent oxidoreductase [Alphaproteobacteria bacterium]|nr:SDR family NAD(P)-dependent oxidoreductase [Alphaproteobacteria bacterium]